MKVMGAVLAAGASARFGSPKALALHEGERWVDRAVRILREAGIEDLIVVTGAWTSDEAEVNGAVVVHNPAWAAGQSTSVIAAIDVAAARRVDQLVITLVDLPTLGAEHVRKILAEPGDLVQASFDGTPGHPVRIAAAHFHPLREALVAAADDRGARAYLAGHGVRLVALEGSVRDVDLPPLA
jgi:CTP:molybdopterin cytidylyltransferase MocA